MNILKITKLVQKCIMSFPPPKNKTKQTETEKKRCKYWRYSKNNNLPTSFCVFLFIYLFIFFLKKSKSKTCCYFAAQVGYWGTYLILYNREDACSRTAYFIRHTALCRMYGIVAYVRHNNHAGSQVLGIPALPHWHESSQLQIKL